jgi:hypothetical protein
MKRQIFMVSALFAFFFAVGILAKAGSMNGSAGIMPAYYDGTLFNINFKELPAGGEAATLKHNGSINVIYMSDQAEAHGFTFVSVIDAIQGDGFNPLWREVQIVFNNTQTFTQFTSDTDVLAAANAGTITLVPTDEVYRCSVIGKNHKQRSR